MEATDPAPLRERKAAAKPPGFAATWASWEAGRIRCGAFIAAGRARCNGEAQGAAGGIAPLWRGRNGEQSGIAEDEDQSEARQIMKLTMSKPRSRSVARGAVFLGWIGVLTGGLGAAAGGAEPVIRSAGAGSYWDGLPAGAKGPPEKIYRTEEVRGAMPTNDWWSSLAWLPLSETMFPHPLAVKAVEGGLRVAYPGAALVAGPVAIMGGGGEDLLLGHSGVERFAEARVAGWSDWFVTAQMGDAARGMRLTFGHGSPYVFAQYAGGEPVVTAAEGVECYSGDGTGPVLGLRLGAKYYGLFAPSGSTWSGLGTRRLAARTGGKGYFSLALLPDGTAETLARFARHAYARVTGSRLEWRYDEGGGAVETRFIFETEAEEGEERETLYALYPHQWRQSDAAFTGQAYQSVRGPLKLAAGRGFAMRRNMPGALPGLPLTEGVDRAQLGKWLAADLAGEPQLRGDTYWLGKQLGKWATLLPVAEQAGETAAAAECERRLRVMLENFLSARDAAGQPKSAGSGFFAYEGHWGSLIGYPASYGSDDQLNDHHFHYGYFLRAAGELGRRDPAWAERWMPMLKLLAGDIACADREDSRFPFLRCFDPYAGHSWASGHAKFGDGNNNESSSEAVNAWYGMMLLGEVGGDRALRDLGAWLFASEIGAIEDYWFDVRGDLHHPDYTPSVATMVWGGKSANDTWFGANPEIVHGINFLPITGGSLYLGRWPEYARKNYAALLVENRAADLRAAQGAGRAAPPGDGRAFDQWADVLWMYRSLTDPKEALRAWDGRAADFKVEAGNSLGQSYAWMAALRDLGEVERGVTADAPFAAVFVKGGVRRYVGWNLGVAAREVVFSDGVRLACPGRGLGQR